jgi:antitoxin ParD1/3/4
MSDARKISITLEREQIAALERAVDAGDYPDSGAIVREAIRDWQLKRELHGDEIKRLRQLWDAGKKSGKPRKFDIERILSAARKRRGKTAAE